MGFKSYMETFLNVSPGILFLKSIINNHITLLSKQKVFLNIPRKMKGSFLNRGVLAEDRHRSVV